MNIIGPQIKSLRLRNGWTQEQFVARCHLIGFYISRGTLAKIEVKKRGVSDIEVKLLSEVLKTSTDVLLNTQFKADDIPTRPG
ncbi:MAG: helix-turn-helix transcriptional regulator [Thiomicrospira sp.]|jgi:transcriptional regulator with XRE-family HTH domain|nr:helix-turn-helix transcriptional regulator [Thiomicrospira sp.]